MFVLVERGLAWGPASSSCPLQCVQPSLHRVFYTPGKHVHFLLQAAEGADKGTAGAAAAVRTIAKALRLTPVQRQTLAWIRERQLKKMVALADARQELAMRVRHSTASSSPSTRHAVH